MLLSTVSRKPSIAHQYTALLTLPDHNMLPMKADVTYQGCLPSCEASQENTQTLLGVQAKFKVRSLRTCVTQSLDWLCNQMQSWDSENAQHYLEIVQTLRLHGTSIFIYLDHIMLSIVRA